MADVVRVDFEAINEQWLVTLWDSNGHTRPGEPFPASNPERFTNLEQVLYRLKTLGYRPTRTPYIKVTSTRYNLEVEPL